jgi:hypothetical protein
MVKRTSPEGEVEALYRPGRLGSTTCTLTSGLCSRLAVTRATWGSSTLPTIRICAIFKQTPPTDFYNRISSGGSPKVWLC